VRDGTGPQPRKSIGKSGPHDWRKPSDSYNPMRLFWKEKKVDLAKRRTFVVFQSRQNSPFPRNATILKKREFVLMKKR
jgi:hypothetical protein